MTKGRFFLLFIFLSFFSSSFIWSQEFGTNKVITRQFDWQIAETEHFQIYYYPQISSILPEIIEYLEKAYAKVTATLEYSPPEKTPFFIYASPNDFQQNNIAEVDEGTGGFTEAFKYRFVVPVTGSPRELQHVIAHEFTHVVMFNILYNGFWKSMRVLKSVFYPLWLVEGLAEYVSGGEHDKSYGQMVLRDAVISDNLIPLAHLHNFSHLQGFQGYLAYKEGESALNYIARELGPEKVPLIIHNFRDSFDLNTVITSTTTLNLTLFELDLKWQNYLREKFRSQVKDKPEPSQYGEEITPEGWVNVSPVWSPDGKTVAFISNRGAYGYEDICLLDRETKKVKKLLKNKKFSQMDSLRQRGKSLSFSPDGRQLVFVGKKNNQDYLFILDIKTRKMKKIKLKLDSVNSVDFSPAGEEIVFSGMRNGVTDIYTVDLKNKKIVQVTADRYYDSQPAFSPDGSRIVYVSERDFQNDLFVVQLPTTDSHQPPAVSPQPIIRLTETPYEEINPAWSPDGQRLIFSADRNGIYNLYTFNYNGSEPTPLTDYQGGEIAQITDVKTGVFNPQYSPDGKNILWTTYRNGRFSIYSGRSPGAPVQPEMSPPQPREKVTFPLVKEPLPILSRRPYNFNFSTDLFFPIFFFSYNSYRKANLVLYNYWQASEMLGNHQTALSLYADGLDNYLEYSFNYLYVKWRPQLGFVFEGKRERYKDKSNEGSLQDFLQQEELKGLLVRYPFNRFDRFDFSFIWDWENLKNLSSGNTSWTKLRRTTLSLVNDTTDWKGVNLIKGRRTDLTYIFERLNVAILDRSYYDNQYYVLDTQHFFPFKVFSFQENDAVYALRLEGAVGNGLGLWRPVFILGGIFNFRGFVYNLRGYPLEIAVGNRIAVLTQEMRYLILPQINYHFWYMFPDFYIKSLEGVLFMDTGTAWLDTNFRKEEVRSGAGLGIRVNTFIMQVYPLILRFDLFKRLDRNKGREDWNWSFFLGPTF